MWPFMELGPKPGKSWVVPLGMSVAITGSFSAAWVLGYFITLLRTQAHSPDVSTFSGFSSTSRTFARAA